APAEVEEVLPRGEAAALRADRDHVVEELPGPLAIARAGVAAAVRDHAVDHPEVRQRLDLDALPGVVLEHHRAALERDARPGGGSRVPAPERAVATELEEES